MKNFTNKDAVKFAARERRQIDGVVCPDFDGEFQFTVREPSAMDRLELFQKVQQHGTEAAPIALMTLCVVDPDGNRCFTFEQAAEFFYANVSNLKPLFDAMNEVGAETEDDEDPLD